MRSAMQEPIQPLNPPDLTKAVPIVLEPPAPLENVPKTDAGEMVKLDPNKLPELDAKVNEFVMAVLNNPVNTPTFDAKVKAIHQLGNAEIRASAQLSNRLLDRPAKSVDKALFDG